MKKDHTNFRFHLNQHRTLFSNTFIDQTLETVKKTSDFYISLPDYRETPVISLDHFAANLGVSQILVKDESSRFGLPAFKVMGALYGISRLVDDLASTQDLVLSAATEGNHGRAVAWCARRFGLRAIIYLPREVPQTRIDAIRGEGADTQVINGTFDETVDKMYADSLKNGYQVVSDVSCKSQQNVTEWIMDGYLKLFDEFAKQVAAGYGIEPTHVFLQGGVGAFASAGVRYFSTFEKLPRFVVVEPIEADCLFQSSVSVNGIPTGSRGKLKTIMNGLNCGYPSDLAWPILRTGVLAFESIGDYWAVRAQQLLSEKDRIPSLNTGPSGIAGLAGVLALFSSNQKQSLLDTLQISEKSVILVVNTEGEI